MLTRRRIERRGHRNQRRALHPRDDRVLAVGSGGQQLQVLGGPDVDGARMRLEPIEVLLGRMNRVAPDERAHGVAPARRPRDLVQQAVRRRAEVVRHLHGKRTRRAPRPASGAGTAPRGHPASAVRRCCRSGRARPRAARRRDRTGSSGSSTILRSPRAPCRASPHRRRHRRSARPASDARAIARHCRRRNPGRRSSPGARAECGRAGPARAAAAHPRIAGIAKGSRSSSAPFVATRTAYCGGGPVLPASPARSPSAGEARPGDPRAVRPAAAPANTLTATAIPGASARTKIVRSPTKAATLGCD